MYADKQQFRKKSKTFSRRNYIMLRLIKWKSKRCILFKHFSENYKLIFYFKKNEQKIQQICPENLLTNMIYKSH